MAYDVVSASNLKLFLPTTEERPDEAETQVLAAWYLLQTTPLIVV